MIISDEQARLAALYMRNTDPAADITVAAEVSDELMARVRQAVDDSPDCRTDRVTEAREHLAQGDFTSTEVAGKMVARIVSDSLR